jgi:hypothetical protein
MRPSTAANRRCDSEIMVVSVSRSERRATIRTRRVEKKRDGDRPCRPPSRSRRWWSSSIAAGCRPGHDSALVGPTFGMTTNFNSSDVRQETRRRCDAKLLRSSPMR